MSEENRKKEETMEEPTREMEKETGAETDLPEKIGRASCRERV